MKIYRVTSAIYLSGTIDDYNKLVKNQISAVVNCRSECHDQVDELTKRGITYYWIPIPEGQAPRKNQIDLFNWLMKTVIKKKSVLVHCSEGRGRSPFLITTYLYSLHIELNRAWKLIKRAKPDVSLTEVQRIKLSEYVRNSEV